MARLLGIDPGVKRCGIAVSDSSQSMAFPREAIVNDPSLIKRIGLLLVEEEIAGVVVGRPIALSGRETSSTAFADDFYATLTAEFPDLKWVQWDERMTTQEASKALSGAGMKAKDQKSHIDSAAAVVMLQNYLDGHHDR